MRSIDRGTRGVDEVVVLSDAGDPDRLSRIRTDKPEPSDPGLVVREADNKQSGLWNYRSGSSGVVAVPDGGRVLGIYASAPSTSGASLTINGGQTIIIPQFKDVSFQPRGNLVAPEIVFTGTDSYIIEFVT